jgi:hypothetical protein
MASLCAVTVNVQFKVLKGVPGFNADMPKGL